MHKYSLKKGRAFAAKSGAVNDSIGRFIYASKINATVSTVNQLPDGINLLTPLNTKIIKLYENIPSTIDCFYTLVSKISAYKSDAPSVDGKFSPNSIPPTINVYKIQLPGNIKTLEISNNDPWVLTGKDAGPLDFLMMSSKNLKVSHKMSR